MWTRLAKEEFKCFQLSPKGLWKDLNMYLISPISLPMMANFVNCFSLFPLSGSKTFCCPTRLCSSVSYLFIIDFVLV